ncbi:MAG: FliM/FliN family flagellar motor switch protein [Candidatus Latescibacteria bacterium]|mgnify:CR=1 FL=1|jgi:flagellar motor switch protein FliN|nr:FliM/FliN family flagellar motor switch protein [Candidatus Latescibacterota bacterium]MBT4138023.1 FliM/FliN family flagellar motor switch protein [Candidatus Latescibacterota bacterium]MBT5832817.1 FliM/FliN family flagellar motor switch protein [Candidatus Latescibacterota bacterium]
MPDVQNPLGSAPVDVKVVLGKTKMALEDIINAEMGTRVELERMVGQPVDILVQDTLFGKGELAVVGNHMAVRVTELFDAA